MNHGFGLYLSYDPRKELLQNFKSIERGKVLMENDQSYRIIGIGSVKFKLWDGTHRILDNVRFSS